MKRITLIAFACAALTGCATGGIKHSEWKTSLQPLKSDQGRIYFYRNSSFVGAAIQPDIKLNDAVVGTSKPGGFFMVERPAGQYSANAATEVERKVTFTLEPGETKYVRSYMSMGLLVGRCNLELVGSAEAEEQLTSLSYTGLPTGGAPAAPAAAPAAEKPAEPSGLRSEALPK